VPSRIRSALGRVARSYVLFVVLGLVVGLVVAPLAFEATSDPQPTVAVVPLEGSIDGASAAAVASQLQRARQDGNVEAVVIVSNSGGGTASGSETLYLQAKRLAETDKPVYAAVDASAASGAYYTIAPADRIYVKPSSFVGSVGVRAAIPPDIEPNDVQGSTGPNKLTGFDTREFYYLLESNRRAFVNAVYEHRGDTISLSRAQLSEAQVYSGGQAVNNGLADAIGGRQTAVDAAARAAGLDSYRVRVFRASNQPTTFVSRTNYLASTAPDKRMVSMRRYTGTRNGLPVLLMLSGSSAGGDGRLTTVRAADVAGAVAPAERDGTVNATAGGGEGAGTGTGSGTGTGAASGPTTPSPTVSPRATGTGPRSATAPDVAGGPTPPPTAAGERGAG
jgi:protease-4